MFKNYCKNCDDNRLKDFELKIKERLVFLIDLYASGYNSHKWLREIYDGGCCKEQLQELIDYLNMKYFENIKSCTFNHCCLYEAKNYELKKCTKDFLENMRECTSNRFKDLKHENNTKYLEQVEIDFDYRFPKFLKELNSIFEKYVHKCNERGR